MSLRERIDTLSRAELAGLVVVIVLCVAGAAVWYLRSLPKPITVAEVQGAPPAGQTPPADGAVPLASGAPSSGVAASGQPVASGAPIIVDVTGHVRRPGVYEFPAGSRVIDAIERAGGPRENAVLAALNLAAPLADGQQIVVPGPKDPIAPVPGAPAVPGAPVTPTGSGTLVNVNTADATALEALPGIGEVTAAAIVEHRTENGPFTSVDQLEDVSGIGPATLEEIRPLVTV
jgi:competence protein ComEA